MAVVENTPERHNLVVCTLCSCYPWAMLGLPPVWYSWMAALERLVAAKDLLPEHSLLTRNEEWAEAYRRTPHGSPVTLDALRAEFREA